MGIFDKVVVGLNKGVNTVSENSKIILEKAQINTELEGVEKEKNSLFLDIGRLVYRLQMSGEINIEQCAPICEQIAAKDKRAEELRTQLKALEAQRNQQQNIPTNGIRCECGYINGEGSRFCAKCGRPLV